MTTGTGAEVTRATTMIDLGRYDEAIRLLARLVATEPENGRAWCLLARAQIGSGSQAGAVTAARRAGALDPADDWPHRLASTALIGCGQPDDALAAALQARRLAPHFWRSHVCLAQAGLAAGKLAVASAAAAAALAIAPDEADVQFTAGKAALAAGDIGAARSYQARALAIDPGHCGAMNELGRISLQGRDTTAATRHFLQAARTAPGVAVFGHNAEIALLRVIVKIIYICSVTVTAAFCLAAITRLAWVPFIIVVAAASALTAGYSVWLVRQLPAPARSHLGRMVRRPRIALPIATTATGSVTAAAVLALAVTGSTHGLLAGAPELVALVVVLIAGARVLSFTALQRAIRR